MIKIDALSLLLLIEAVVILLGAAIALAIRSRKYRRLHSAAALGLEAARKELKNRTPEAPLEETAREDTASADTDGLRQAMEMMKRMILDMLSCRTIFDTSPARLSAVQTAYQQLQKESSRGTAGTAGIPGNNAQEMESNLGTLKAEQETLAVKFRIWEEQFSKLRGDTDHGPPAPGDDLVRAVTYQEKDDLVIRLRDAEEKLAAKGRILDELKTKYESLEKEYLILYHQQQKQSG